MIPRAAVTSVLVFCLKGESSELHNTLALVQHIFVLAFVCLLARDTLHTSTDYATHIRSSFTDTLSRKLGEQFTFFQLLLSEGKIKATEKYVR